MFTSCDSQISHSAKNPHCPPSWHNILFRSRSLFQNVRPLHICHALGRWSVLSVRARVANSIPARRVRARVCEATHGPRAYITSRYRCITLYVPTTLLLAQLLSQKFFLQHLTIPQFFPSIIFFFLFSFLGRFARGNIVARDLFAGLG